MTAPKGTNLKAVAIAAKLLENEDLSFTNQYRGGDGTGGLILWGGSPSDPDGDPEGTILIEWGVEIEARSWGIKDIVPFIKRIVLDGYWNIYQETGPDVESEERFHYEYPETPEAKPTVKATAGSVDVDTANPEDVERLAQPPKWKLEYGIDRYRDNDNRTTFIPKADVNLTTRTIEITF
jgi:hypothetical protein